MTIIDFSGDEVEDVAGPYTRDTIATLTCVASGGEREEMHFQTVSLHSKVRTEEHFWENCIFFGFMSSAIFDPFLSQTRKLKILHILPGLIPFWKVESNRLIYSLFDWDFWPPALGWLWVLTLSFLCVQSNDDQFNFWFHYQLRSHKLMSERSQSRTKSLSLLW